MNVVRRDLIEKKEEHSKKKRGIQRSSSRSDHTVQTNQRKGRKREVWENRNALRQVNF